MLRAVREFADGMRQMRKHLALMAKLRYARQKQRWFLEAASVYRGTVCAFHEQLGALELRSRGFLGLRELSDPVRPIGRFRQADARTRRPSRTSLAAVTLRGSHQGQPGEGEPV